MLIFKSEIFERYTFDLSATASMGTQFASRRVKEKLFPISLSVFEYNVIASRTAESAFKIYQICL